MSNLRLFPLLGLLAELDAWVILQCGVAPNVLDDARRVRLTRWANLEGYGIAFVWAARDFLCESGTGFGHFILHSSYSGTLTQGPLKTKEVASWDA